jgi:hypothetical protein
MMAGLEFNRYISRGRVLYQIYADADSLHAELVQAVGYSKRIRQINSIDYVCTKKQGETVKLLYDNGFKGVIGSVGKLIYRPNNHPMTIEEALAAIKRGDYVVENFLDALDGA